MAIKSTRSTFTKAASKQVCCMGDSLTDNFTLSVATHLEWAARLQALLQKAGCNAVVRNYGKSGDKTTDMMGRFSRMYAQGWPEVGVIFAGANDPAFGYSTAQTTAYLQAMIKWLKYGCVGYVADETALPADGNLGDRYVVMADGSATGGAAAVSALVHTTTLGGAGAGAQTVWEYRNAKAGETGWGRVAVASTAATKVSRIAVISMHYLNYTAGGDTLATAAPLYDDVTGVRKAQGDAVTNESTNNANIKYIDIYAAFKGRIQAGLDTALAGAAGWHVQDTNQHFNTYGMSLVAQFIFSAINGYSGWMTALT